MWVSHTYPDLRIQVHCPFFSPDQKGSEEEQKHYFHSMWHEFKPSATAMQEELFIQRKRRRELKCFSISGGKKNRETAVDNGGEERGHVKREEEGDPFKFEPPAHWPGSNNNNNSFFFSSFFACHARFSFFHRQ